MRPRVLFAGLLLLIAGCGGIAEKIVGVWDIVKFDGKDVPADEPATMEFTQDGRHIVRIRVEGSDAVSEGTYSVNGDKITVTGKTADGGEKSNIITVKNIAGDVLSLVKDGIEMELRRRP